MEKANIEAAGEPISWATELKISLRSANPTECMTLEKIPKQKRNAVVWTNALIRSEILYSYSASSLSFFMDAIISSLD